MALGTVLGIAMDLRWFVCCAMKLPLRRIADIISLLASSFLLFWLFQLCGGSARIDLLCFVFAAAALYQALLGAVVRRVLGRFALLLRQPIDYAKNLLKKVIIFMKKTLANAKNWFMIKMRASCLHARFSRRGDKERSFATDNGGTETACTYPDSVRITYAVERGAFPSGGASTAGMSTGSGGAPSGRKRSAEAAHQRSR